MSYPVDDIPTAVKAAPPPYIKETITAPVPPEPPTVISYQQETMSTDTDKIIEILLILFLPPLAIWYHARACTCHVCLNILLLFLFVIPAIVHAMWYCYMRDRPPRDA